MSVTTTRAEHSERVCLDDWHLGFGEFDPIIKKAIAEGIESNFAVSEFAPTARLPFKWGPEGDGLVDGKAVSDPGEIYFALPGFSANADVGPVFKVSIRALVEDFVELLVEGADFDLSAPLHPDGVERVEALHRHLTELTDFLGGKLSEARRSPSGK